VLETEAIEATPKPQETLGAYELLETLGEGAMGTVYRARHRKLGREVALKVMRAEAAANPRLVKRFRDEARAVNRIKHPHIVEVVDFCDDEPESGHVYCVMELLRGCSLETLLESETLTLERTLKIADQVCDALAAAHAVGVIHRDVKPANIFLVDPGEADSVKLVDFGVAKLRSTPGEVSGTHTLEGALLGTITYMAPEQAAGDEIDARADLYALGTTLYRMLAGHLPFGGPTFTQFALQIVNDPPAPLPPRTSNREAISPALRKLVMQCLEKEPGKRPVSAGELQRSLWEVATQRRRSRGAKRGLLIASAVVAALAVSAAVVQKKGLFVEAGPVPASQKELPAPPPTAPAVAALPQPQTAAAAPDPAPPEHPASKRVRPTRHHRH
jgi:serine/threonine-protein kinase